MKILEYLYRSPKHNNLPIVKVEFAKGIWPFKKKVMFTYVCLGVGFFAADWRCVETGESVSFHDSGLYKLLNEAGVKMQLEDKFASKGSDK